MSTAPTPSAVVTRPYRGRSADLRRAERRAALVEAALERIGESGVGALTVDGVCEQAGLTKRYFYESFTDRDALLAEVGTAMFARLRAEVVAAVTAVDPSPQARARAAAGALVDALAADRRTARLYVEAPAHPVLSQVRDAAVGEFADLLIGDVLGRSPVEPRARLGGLLIVAGTTEVVSRWLAGDLVLDRLDLVDELTRLGLAL